MADEQLPTLDQLYSPQSTPTANPASPVAQNQDQTPSYDQLYPSVSEVVVTGKRLAPPQNPPPENIFQYAGNTLGHIPGSAWNMISGIGHVIAHPVQTAETLGQVAGGVAQHGMNVVSGGNAPQVFDTKTADALGQMYKDRYGGWSNIKHTLETDPVGMLADVSAPFTMGGGAAIAGADALADVGRLGEVSNALRTAGNAAKVVGDVTNPANLITKPLAGANALAKYAGGKVLPNVLAGTTGVDASAIKGAYNAGASPVKEVRQAFGDAISGKTSPQDIVDSANQKTTQMSDLLQQEYRPGDGGDATQIPLNPVKQQFQTDAVNGRLKPAGYTGAAVGVGPSQDAVNKVGSMISKYDQIPQLQTPQGLDALRNEVTQYRDTLKPGTQDYNLADKTIGSVSDMISKNAPFFDRHMSSISDMRSAASAATQAVNSGKNVDKALTNLGKASVPLASDNGALAASTSGNALSSLLPHGLGTRALDVGLGALGDLIAGHGNVLHGLVGAMPEALASSPYLVGQGAHLAGRASVSVPANGIRLTTKGMTNLARNPVVQQSGRNYKSPDGTVTLDEYLKGNP